MHFYNLTQTQNVRRQRLTLNSTKSIIIIVIVLKKVFSRDSVFQYSLFSISGGTITDIEFFDGEELGICLQTDQSKPTIYTKSSYPNYKYY